MLWRRGQGAAGCAGCVYVREGGLGGRHGCARRAWTGVGGHEGNVAVCAGQCLDCSANALRGLPAGAAGRAVCLAAARVHLVAVPRAQDAGGEYMVSCVIRGRPQRVADALLRLRANTTILGPAEAAEVLQPADKETGMGREVCWGMVGWGCGLRAGGPRGYRMVASSARRGAAHRRITKQRRR